ncbi:Acyltransferase family protein [Flavobacterium anhuiense]|uniref:Acyltransferase family protein n=1 Tax=Flavobacterium anhuiense TaxID=459526 RepID=A0A444VVW2_9FLAO|nr:acyltransferase [Flavobacterium anhuiense]RYJ37835.1 Acyltransferase family protein [Flavobacterium anhuiense]
MRRQNNFDFLRLIFAVFVIISHSYPLSGSQSCDWLCDLTNGKLMLSYIGVKGFFIISGYLIFQSLLRSKDWIDYIWKRFLRLFPALFVVLVLTVILGVFVYEGIGAYLMNKSIYTYIGKNLSLFRLQYGISGIFENNIYGNAINGSLWTLCYEFSMYVIISILFFFRNNVKTLHLLFGLLYLSFAVFFFLSKKGYEFHFYQLQSSYLIELGLFFLGGSFLALLKIDEFKYIKIVIIVSLFLVLLTELLIQDSIIFRFLLWPILIITVGLQATKHLKDIGNRIGDISYGIYIYGFPIQQSLMHFFKLNAIELMVISIPLSVLFGYLSWHLIENRMLRFKNSHPKVFVKRILNFRMILF